MKKEAIELEIFKRELQKAVARVKGKVRPEEEIAHRKYYYPQYLMYHPIRVRLLLYICKYLCVPTSQLSAILKIGSKSIKWHANKLEQLGLISRYKLGNSTLYYPRWLLSEWQLKFLALINLNECRLKLLQSLKDGKLWSLTELSKIVGVSYQQVAKHLALFEQLEIMEEYRAGKYRYYKLLISKLKRKLRLEKRRLRKFKTNLIKVLTLDGVAPKIVLDSGNRFQLKLDTPKGVREALPINIQPEKLLERSY